MNSHVFKKIFATALLVGIFANSHAAIIPADKPYDIIDLQGTGYGNVDSMLALKPKANGTSAEGGVSWSGTKDVTSGDVAPDGGNKTATYSFAALNITDASQLLLVFNPNEQGNDTNNGITLDKLELRVYAGDGSVKYFTEFTGAPLFFETTQNGGGNAGYGFVLDSTSVKAINDIFDASYRIGLTAALSGAQGNADSFFGIAIEQEVPATGIPEPGSIALLGLGMLGMGALRRRSRRA